MVFFLHERHQMGVVVESNHEYPLLGILDLIRVIENIKQPTRLNRYSDALEGQTPLGL